MIILPLIRPWNASFGALRPFRSCISFTTIASLLLPVVLFFNVGELAGYHSPIRIAPSLNRYFVEQTYEVKPPRSLS